MYRREGSLWRQIGIHRRRGIHVIRNTCRRRGTYRAAEWTRVITRFHFKRDEAVDRIHHQRPTFAGNPGQRLVERHRADTQFVFGERLVIEAVDAVISGITVGKAPAGAVQQLRQRLSDRTRCELAVHSCLQIIVAVRLTDDGVTTTVILALRRGSSSGCSQHQQGGGEQPVASGTLHIRESFLSGGCCNVKTPCVIIRRNAGAFARAFVPYPGGALRRKR